MVQRLHVPRNRPVAIRCEHRDPAQFAHFLGNREQSGGPDAVVIGHKDMHGILSGFVGAAPQFGCAGLVMNDGSGMICAGPTSRGHYNRGPHFV